MSLAPPPPPANAPVADAGRANVLASIQGAGIHKLKKVSIPSLLSEAVADIHLDQSDDNSSARNTGLGMGAGAAAGLGAGAAIGASSPSGDAPQGDLAATLAAALSQRKGNMGDSDDEEEEDDEDW